MMLWLIALGHFLTDGVCAATLFGPLKGHGQANALVMLYTTLAFSTQGLVGLLVDRYRAERVWLCAAAAAMAAAWALPIDPWARAALLGLGNSLYHAAGGAMTLRRSAGHAGPLGAFVAPGAVGLALGTLWPGVGPWMAAGLVVCAGVGLFLREGALYDAPEPARERLSGVAIMPLALLPAPVAVRAIGGSAVSFPWNDTAMTAVALAVAVAAGKAAGGYACDRLGARRTAALSLAAAAVAVTLCGQWMVPSLIGQFALNLTMPVTLWLIARAIPDSPGFAFGLAASALWPGTLAGRLMTLTGPARPLCALISLLFGLIAILYAEKRRAASA